MNVHNLSAGVTIRKLLVILSMSVALIACDRPESKKLAKKLTNDKPIAEAKERKRIGMGMSSGGRLGVGLGNGLVMTPKGLRLGYGF